MEYTITDTPLTVKVKNESELVTIMRQTSIYFSGQIDSEFMRGYADRAKVVTGAIIATNSPAAFVKSCMEHGFIIKGKTKAQN